jgi:hypothetical protein
MTTSSFMIIGVMATVLAVLLGVVGDMLNAEGAGPRRNRDLQHVLAAASHFRMHRVSGGPLLSPRRAVSGGRPARRIVLRFRG